MVLKTTLREFKEEDWQSLQLHANNPSIAKFMTNQFPYPYTDRHAKEFIFRISKLIPAQVFAIDYNGEAIGHRNTSANRHHGAKCGIRLLAF